MLAPKNWTNQEWHEYEEYFQSLTVQEKELELNYIIALSQAKKRGKNIVIEQQYYRM